MNIKGDFDQVFKVKLVQQMVELEIDGDFICWI